MKRALLLALLSGSSLLLSPVYAQDYSQPLMQAPSNEQQLQPPQVPGQQQIPVQPQLQPQMQPQMQEPMPDPNAPIGDPNYYGQVDLGNNTAPPIVYATPMVVQPAPPGIFYPPVYLRVPPMYYQNWPQYCGFYNACFYPVFFVQDSWYMSVYSPWYRRYYPYGRPGFTAHIYYNPRGGAYRGGPHNGYGGGRHDAHRY